MFGVAPRDEDIGFIWLLGTDEIKDISWQFLRESREWLEKISSPYKMVCNMVHEENTVHIKWLKFLGFTFLKHTKPFIEFSRITTCYVRHNYSYARGRCNDRHGYHG